MIEHAVALADARDWDYDALSPYHLAFAVQSPRYKIFYNGNVFCTPDARLWAIFLSYEFSAVKERYEVVQKAFQRMQQFCTPSELDLHSEPECFVRYLTDLEIENIENVTSHLGTAIDHALVELTYVWTVLQMVNLGGKSVDEAIEIANATELNALHSSTSFAKRG